MTNKHMKQCSSLVIMEIKIKTIMKCHFISNRMAKIQTRLTASQSMSEKSVQKLALSYTVVRLTSISTVPQSDTQLLY